MSKGTTITQLCILAVIISIVPIYVELMPTSHAQTDQIGSIGESHLDEPARSVSLTAVDTGNGFVPYEFGIISDTNIPKFKGTSSGYDYIELWAENSHGVLTQIGIDADGAIAADGSFERGRTILPDDTYTILAGRIVLGTIIVDANGDRNLLKDTHSPTLKVPNDIIMNATDVLTPTQVGTATAIDDTTSNPLISNNSTDLFPVGTTTVVWSATDYAGNTIFVAQTVTMQDNEPPTFSDVSDQIFIDKNAYYVIPTAADLLDPNPTVSCLPGPGTAFEMGDTDVFCVATDASGNNSTATFTVTVISPFLISDTFDDSLDSWEHHEIPHVSANQIWCNTQNTNVYPLVHSPEHGGSIFAGYTDICWFGATGGIKNFEMPVHGDLELSFSYRSLVNTPNISGHVNNVWLQVINSSGIILKQESVYDGRHQSNYQDTEWQNATVRINSVSPSECPCDVFLYTFDSWLYEWKKSIYFDDVKLKILQGASGASSDAVSNSLTQNELFSMLFSNGTQVIINTKQVYDDSVFVDWDSFDENIRYDVSIAPVNDPENKISSTTSDTQHMFTNLIPSTNYTLSVAIQDNDESSSTLQVRTLG